jgi:hypothetical protein
MASGASLGRPPILPGAIAAVAHPVWHWLRKDWNWAHLGAVKRPLFVIALAMFLAAYYLTARIKADPTDYWRLSNYELQQATFELTGTLRRLRADSQKESQLNPEDAFVIQSEFMKAYYDNYRGPALKLAAVLQTRLGEAQNAARPLDPHYEKPGSYEELALVTDDLDEKAFKLPPHRSFVDWLEAEFLP